MFLFFATYGFEFDSMGKCRPVIKDLITSQWPIWLEIFFWMGNPKKKIVPWWFADRPDSRKVYESKAIQVKTNIKTNINIGSHGLVMVGFDC